MLLIEDKRFCSYIYLDPRKPGYYRYGKDLNGNILTFLFEPIYVGEGFPSRIEYHTKISKLDYKEWDNNILSRKIVKMYKKGLEPIKLFLVQSKTKKFVQIYEINLIKRIGRIDISTGCLCNLTNGGDGTYGYKVSYEEKENLKKLWKQKDFRMFMIDRQNKGKTKEWKNKISSSRKKSYDNLTKEQKLRISNKHKEISNEPHRIEHNRGISLKNWNDLQWRENYLKVVRNHYILLSPSNEKVLTKEIETFCEDNNLNSQQIRKIASGTQKSNNHKGWRCICLDKNLREDSDYIESMFKKLEKIKIVDSNMDKNVKRYKLLNPKGQTFNPDNLTKFCKENNLNHTVMTRMSCGNYTPTLKSKHYGWQVEKL